MGKNRYPPYGYKVMSGKLVVDVDEDKTIKQIYSWYASGQSYKKIAEQLTADKKPYTAQKAVWNKNMVARILQNKFYIGSDKFPPIIDEPAYMAAQNSMKIYIPTASEEIKDLKPLLKCECGQKIKRRLKPKGGERWYCPNDINHISVKLTDSSLLQQILALQNSLCDISLEQENSTESLNTIKLQNEIEHLLSQTEIDTSALKDMIFNLAAEKYALCSTPNYTVDNMVTELYKSKKLDTKKLRDVATEIIVADRTVTTLMLKNNIKIEKGAEKNE